MHAHTHTHTHTHTQWAASPGARHCQGSEVGGVGVSGCISVNDSGTPWPQTLLSSKFCSGVNGERTTHLPVTFKSSATNYHWCSHVSVSGSVLHALCAVSHLIPEEKKWNWDSEKLVNGEIEIQPWISATLHWPALVPQKALRRIRINSWFVPCILILASQSAVCGPATLRSCQKCRVSGPKPDLWIKICFLLSFLGRLKFQMHCSVSLPKDMT